MSLLEAISARGAQIRERLRGLFLRHACPGDLKPRLLAAYVGVTLEHHEAIWLLRERKLNCAAVFEMIVRFICTCLRKTTNANVPSAK